MGPDTLLVSREWNPGELTASGYAYIVKRVVRGQPLTSAVEIYRGAAADGGYGVGPADAGGRHRASRRDHHPTADHVRIREVHRHAEGRGEARDSAQIAARGDGRWAGDRATVAGLDRGRRRTFAPARWRRSTPPQAVKRSVTSRAGRRVRAGTARVGRRCDRHARPAARRHQPERARTRLRLLARGERHVDADNRFRSPTTWRRTSSARTAAGTRRSSA